jgi:pimeloyl-ACP methyl ester carboxylesterase
MAFTIKSAEIPGRARLPYVERGDPSGMPVVLLHGVTDSWRSFELVLPHLPGAVHAFALTQRGHGDADRPATAYRTGDFAADLAGFSDTLGLGPAVIVGHSMGSTNALRFAIDYPARTLGLVLVGSFASYRANRAVVEFWESTVSRLTDPIDPRFVREFQESTLARPVPADFLDAVVKESLKVPARVWRAAFEGFLEDDVAGALGRITAPTLIVWGDRDRFSSRDDQDALLGAIAASRLVVYEGAGHGLHWEEPERFAADLAAFCRALATGPTTT